MWIDPNTNTYIILLTNSVTPAAGKCAGGVIAVARGKRGGHHVEAGCERTGAGEKADHDRLQRGGGGSRRLAAAMDTC